MKISPQYRITRSRWLKIPMNSGQYRHWLIDGGSLTRRLQACCSNFAVKPISLRNARSQPDESSLLTQAPRQQALLREVHLQCAGKTVVFAHSILPHKALRGDWQGLGHLGTKPLGGALFANPRVMRTPLAYKKLSRHHALYQRATAHLSTAPNAVWARRSVFMLHCAAILVTEVFLPEVLTL